MREIVWWEMIEDHGVLCHSQGMQEGCWCQDRAGDKFDVTPHELAPLAKDIFWLTPDMCDARDGKELAHWRKEFLALADLFPNLEGVVSRPMGPEYILADEPYIFTAQLFYRNLGLTGPGYSRHSLCPGFFHFLVPLMTRESSPVSRLHFIDNSIRSAIYNFTDPQSPVFENLTTLNLCLNLVGHSDIFSACLVRARNLERLRLCFDRTDGSAVQNAMVTLFNNPQAVSRWWPKLTALELVRIAIIRGPSTLLGFEIVLALLQAHSPTLRTLTMQECGVNPSVVRNIAAIPNLRLQSFRVIALDNSKAAGVHEQALLAFINGEDTSGGCIAHLPEDGVFSTFSTGPTPAAVLRDHAALACDSWHNAIPAAANGFALFRPKRDNTHGKSIYARDKRELGAHRWKFRAEDHQRFFFWPTQDRDAAETRVWRFTHRSGVVALGDEPLEFFSDWDSSDSEMGDVAEAVPLYDGFHEWLPAVGDPPGMLGPGESMPPEAAVFNFHDFVDEEMMPYEYVASDEDDMSFSDLSSNREPSPDFSVDEE